MAANPLSVLPPELLAAVLLQTAGEDGVWASIISRSLMLDLADSVLASLAASGTETGGGAAGAAAGSAGCSGESAKPANISDGASGSAAGDRAAGNASATRIPPKRVPSPVLAGSGSASPIARPSNIELLEAAGGGSSLLRSSRFATEAALAAAGGAPASDSCATDGAVALGAECCTPSKSSSLRAFSLSEACDEPSWAWMHATFFWKWPNTASSPSLSSPSTTISALSRRCHSEPSRRACNSAAITRESSDLTDVMNLRSSSREMDARMPPGAVTSSTSRASYSPPPSGAAACGLKF
eukprot:scaffold270_cov121-Isochrysis_galbana.AAC.30